MTPRLDLFHQHGVDGAGRRRCLSGLLLSSGRAPHHHRGGGVGCGCLGSTTLAWTRWVQPLFLLFPLLPVMYSKHFLGWVFFFFFVFLFPRFPRPFRRLSPLRRGSPWTGSRKKLPFVFSVLSSPSLRCSQTPKPAPPALSHRQMCVLCSIVHVADVCEANVMVTAVMWRQSDDRNVKKHVFVRWVYVCLFASVQLEMPDSFGLKVNVYLYIKRGNERIERIKFHMGLERQKKPQQITLNGAASVVGGKIKTSVWGSESLWSSQTPTLCHSRVFSKFDRQIRRRFTSLLLKSAFLCLFNARRFGQSRFFRLISSALFLFCF